MKNLRRITLSAAILIAFSAASLAQVSATANASATIIAPIAIANTADLAFGNLIVGATGGTAVISPAGARSVTGDVVVPAVPGTFNAATFNVTGQAGWTYSISLPAVATTITSGANTMTVDTWTSNPTTIAGGTIGAGGSQVLSVGATLNVSGSQAAGTYNSGTAFTVTVNYN